MRIPLPAELRARLSVLESPAPARDAATIAVVRDGPKGLEAFLMRRQASMSFAAGMCVFPGGSVHEADFAPVSWVGPDATWWAERFNCAPELARALVVSAVRETFEETGVLLAGHNEHSVLDDTTGLHDFRAALEAETLTFADFLDGQRLALRADLIGPWAHWITPAFEPKRFDTRFFVAALPAGQNIDSVNSEADRSGWVPLKELLSELASGNISMLPPTMVTCQELSGLETSTILPEAALRAIAPIEPRVVEANGQLWLETERWDHL